MTFIVNIFVPLLDSEKNYCHPINILNFPNIFILEAPYTLIFLLTIKIIFTIHLFAPTYVLEFI